MKILAYSLFVLGPAMMILSRPFTDRTNFVLLSGGAVIGMVGLFLRSRVRAGIPVFSVTDEDKAQFDKMRQDARRELDIRKILARLIGTFGVLMQVAGAFSLFRIGSSGSTDWRIGAFSIGVGLLMVLGAAALMKKRG